jgi:hypothetical protein
MATIVTVHGTNASGPAEGESWWQKGGPFERDLRKWVQSEANDLQFEPLIWDGRNSEASRFEAGGRLAARIAELEKNGDRFCLIGHSHGGSVIAHALIRASRGGRPLAGLGKWITVGTPFIETRPLSLLFSRLGVTGVAAYLIFVYLLLAWVAFALSSMLLLISGRGLRNPEFDILIIPLGAAFLAGIYWALHSLQPAKLRLSRQDSTAAVAASFGTRWLPLWHKDDEAIRGLHLLRDIRLEPFERTFASPVLAFGSLLLLPVIMYALSLLNQYESLVPYIQGWNPGFRPAEAACPDQTHWARLLPADANCVDAFKQFARNNLAIIVWPAQLIFELLRSAEVKPTGVKAFDLPVLAGVLAAGALIGFAGLWLLGLMMHRVVLRLAGTISAAISSILNRFTQVQLLRLGYGSDTIGERPHGAREYPFWHLTPVQPLPDELGADITRISDEAAAAAVSNLRAALGAIAFSEVDYNPADFVSRYLTWRELVHTNYFNVERTRKLIAYAIAQEKGFRLTPAFLEDIDHPVIARWYDGLMATQTVR